MIDLERARKRLRPHPSREPRRPRILDTLDLAGKLRAELEGGVVNNRAELARRHGITRARVTQLLSLLKLDPAILDFVHRTGAENPARAVSERMLRPLLALRGLAQVAKAEAMLRGFAGRGMGIRIQRAP